MATTRQYQAPDGYVNETTDLDEYQLGTEYINETTQAAAGGFQPAWGTKATHIVGGAF